MQAMVVIIMIVIIINVSHLSTFQQNQQAQNVQFDFPVYRYYPKQRKYRNGRRQTENKIRKEYSLDYNDIPNVF